MSLHFVLLGVCARALTLWLVIGSLGCTRPATQIIVRIEGTPATWQRARSIHFSARRDAPNARPIVDRCHDVNPDDVSQRLYEFGLTPSDPDNATEVRVAVELRTAPCGDGGTPGAWLAQTALVRFAPERTTVLVLPFTAACEGAVCAELIAGCTSEQTCAYDPSLGRRCVCARRGSLPDYTSGSNTNDLGAVTDASAEREGDVSDAAGVDDRGATTDGGAVVLCDAGPAPGDVPFRNCEEIRCRVPGATSGLYTVDPDGDRGGPCGDGGVGGGADGGDGGVCPFQVYCDMDRDEGGWTLIGHGNWNNGDVRPEVVGGPDAGSSLLAEDRLKAVLDSSYTPTISVLFRMGSGPLRLFVREQWGVRDGRPGPVSDEDEVPRDSPLDDLRESGELRRFLRAVRRRAPRQCRFAGVR